MSKKIIVERIKIMLNFQDISYEKVGIRKINRGAKNLMYGV